MRDYDELAPSLSVPIGGKQYTIPPIGARTGARLMGITAGKEDAEFTAMSDDDFNRVILGAAYDEMLADDVPAPAINRAFLTALADFQYGRARAEATWEAGASPEFLAAMAALASQKTTTSTSTASVKKTPSRANIRSTPSPVTSSAPKKAASRSAGRRSSTSGRS